MRHRQNGLLATGAALVLLWMTSLAAAAPLRTSDGLSAATEQTALQELKIDGRALPGVAVQTAVQNPATGAAASAGFSVKGTWRASGNLLVLSGEVQAAGTEDTVADLIVRVSGVELPLSTMARDPLLLPQKLLSKLPLVNLRAGGQDALALAVPPEKLATFEFRPQQGSVELRYRFGFTAQARPELKMRAPFTCVLYRTDPQWHFRSALQRYYTAFPALFAPFEKRQGGWFFAAETPDLPNPQHFFFHEGGPGGWEEDHARGMGTFPYRESSSYTVSLPGSVPPKDYAEARQRFEELEQQVIPAGWTPQQSFTVDTSVAHSGEKSLLADAGTTRSWVGAAQTVTLDPPLQQPLLVSAFSRAAGVDGQPGADYSLYVDVQYKDGSYLFGQTAVFATGTHDWQEATTRIEPTKPIAVLRVFCLLRNHLGKAWFDDIHVGPADDPQANWVKNPSFETQAKRTDLQYIRDNVAVNSRGEWTFHITDNLAADVGPAVPMNLLRFTLNPDPDLPSTPEHPAVGAQEIKYYDEVFRATPQIDGAYIDSVSAWIYGVLNARRDQWLANDRPFTYDPSNRKVVAAGRWAMVKYLQRLQERYHPRGKSIFTNIHVNLEAFPLYLVSDVPGIESSLFQDEDSMFFYRASSYRKPLVLLNFMNLHGLDRRETAVAYHVNAAQWGEFPSTGRYVERAYREYGDVTHLYLPAIKELSAAGWQPVPAASGARVERFGGAGAVYFTVRAPEAAAAQTLQIAPEAVQGLGSDLVACDAVSLARLPLQRQGKGWALPLEHGEGELTIVRISRAGQVVPWLLGRARQHALQAGRVRGTASLTPQIKRLQEALAGPLPEAQVRPHLLEWQAKLQAAIESVGLDAERVVDRANAPGEALTVQDGTSQQPQNLFALSSRRELQQAGEALAAVAAAVAGVEPELSGSRLGYPGQKLQLQARGEAPAGATLKLASVQARPEGSLDLRSTPAAEGIELLGRSPGTARVEAQFDLTVPPSPVPWRLTRRIAVYIRPAAAITLKEEGSTPTEHRYLVTVSRRDNAPLELRSAVTPEAPLPAATVRVEQGQQTAVVAVRSVLDGLGRTLRVEAAMGGTVAAAAETQYTDEPPLPAGDLALAKAGTTVTVDSSYSGYTPAALTNGLISLQGLDWSEAAWASQDNNLPHWVELRFARPAQVGSVAVYWAQDAGRFYTSQQYKVVGLTETGPKVLAEVKEPQTRSYSLIKVPATSLKGLRIEQPAQGGPATRPGIMWIREVVVGGA